MSSTHHYQCQALLLKTGWIEPAYLHINAQGKIEKILEEPDKDIKQYEEIKGFVIPGFQNAHSHAFQYAMAGKAEHLPIGSQADDFWSWRKTMYHLANQISPQQCKNIATMLYSEMLRVGYTSVAEFHYIHNDLNGQPYSQRSEMGEHLLQAAQDAGIKITLIPIFYQMGGFEKAAQEGQRRFLSKNAEEYSQLLESTAKVVSRYPSAKLGVGIHSLRAVKAEDLIQTLSQMHPELPRHIHIAEQQKEVQDCLQHRSARPVQWLFDHLKVDHRFHLVHATHVNQSELESIAQSKAHVVLCPSTEGNLGDGFFPLREFMKIDGNWSIGTDSHIGISPQEELRILDYGQRLRLQKRNILCLKEGDSSGGIAFWKAYKSGKQAMQSEEKVSGFTVGQDFDAVVFDAEHPLLQAAPKEMRLSTIIYALDTTAMQATIVQGKYRIKSQKHPDQSIFRNSFAQSLQELYQSF